MIHTLQIQKNLDLKQEMVTKLIVNNCQVEGVIVKSGLEFSSPTVILTNGTFLNGLYTSVKLSILQEEPVNLPRLVW